MVDRILGRGRDGKDGKDGKDARDGRDGRRRRPPSSPRRTPRRPSGSGSSWPATCAARGPWSCSRSSRTSSSSCTAIACSATTRRSWPASPGSMGRRVAVIGQQKGADTEENVRRNFGMPHPEGYRKAMRIDGARGALRPAGRDVRRRPRRPPRPRVRGARHRRGDRPVGRPDDPPPHADRDRDHRRGRLRRRARDRRRRRGAGPRERGLLRHLAGGLREHPVADHGRGGDRRPRDEDDRRGPAGAGRRGPDRRRAGRGRPHGPRRDGPPPQGRDPARSWTAWRASRSTCWSSSAIAGTVRSAPTPSLPARCRHRPCRHGAGSRTASAACSRPASAPCRRRSRWGVATSHPPARTSDRCPNRTAPAIAPPRSARPITPVSRACRRRSSRRWSRS